MWRKFMALLAATSMACTTWTAHPTPGPEAVEYPKQIRVHRTDGSVISITNPQVAGDSIVGMSLSRDAATRVAVAKGEIRKIESEEFSPGRTTLLVGAIGTVLLAIVVINALEHMSWGKDGPWTFPAP